MTVPSSPGTPAPAMTGGTRRTSRIPLFTADAWAPLKTELFRSLWIATSIAQIGTWMREAAGPTLMENLTHSWPNRAAMVAYVLLFSNLPICLFSVFAGALADVLDRRRLLIVTQIWMVVVSVILGILTYAGLIHPFGLLAFIFLMGVGTAAFGPALQAVLPELVPKQHFALAINMNSIALNVARAVGPALFIFIVLMVPGDKGAGVSFILTGLSFIAAAWVLYQWKRPPQRAAVHGEEMWDAIRAGFRYTVYSPANRAILLRVLTFIVPAIVIWGQVPIIATSQLHRMADSEFERQQISALLFAFMGAGAVFGVFLMPGLHARYKIDPVVNVCTAFFGLGLVVLSYVHTLWLAAIIFVFLGINWVIIPTNFNTATQKSVPPWVKGRAISFYLTVLFGSFAVGAALWGKVTMHHGIHVTLLAGGISMLAFLTLAIWFPLTVNEGKDLTPAFAAPPQDRIGQKPEGEGRVRLTNRYRFPAHRHEGFKDLLHDLKLTRLRNGAHYWHVEEVETGGSHMTVAEVITFRNWHEYTQSFSRMTKWDTMLESLTKEYRVGAEGPSLVPPGPRRVLPPIPFLGAGASSFAPPAPAGTTSRPTSSSQSTGLWLQDRIADAVDRAIDEVFVAYDRFAAPPRRHATWRHLIVQFPATVVVRRNGEASQEPPAPPSGNA
ncbi:MAG TPA: MFS transporter [Tepidisphaeraceae bacterium]|jgi:MFS family permease